MVARGWGSGEGARLLTGTRFLWGEDNVLTPHSDDGCTTLNTLKPTDLYS